MKRTIEMNVLEASEKGTVLVCLTQPQVVVIEEVASRIGVTIKPPVLMEDYKLQ